MNTDILFVYVTTPNQETALKLAQSCVDKNLAACANILPAMQSIYKWEGQIQNEQESLLILKAPRRHFEKLKELLVSLHPYDCPCIVALPIAAGFDGFLKWVQSQTS